MLLADTDLLDSVRLWLCVGFCVLFVVLYIYEALAHEHTRKTIKSNFTDVVTHLIEYTPQADVTQLRRCLTVLVGSDLDDKLLDKLVRLSALPTTTSANMSSAFDTLERWRLFDKAHRRFSLVAYDEFEERWTIALEYLPDGLATDEEKVLRFSGNGVNLEEAVWEALSDWTSHVYEDVKQGDCVLVEQENGSTVWGRMLNKYSNRFCLAVLVEGVAGVFWIEDIVRIDIVPPATSKTECPYKVDDLVWLYLPDKRKEKGRVVFVVSPTVVTVEYGERNQCWCSNIEDVERCI